MDLSVRYRSVSFRSLILLLCVCFSAIPGSNASRFGLSPSFVDSLRVLHFFPNEQECHRKGFPAEATSEKTVIFWKRAALLLRGGDQQEVLTLDEKVKKAMQKLGLSPPREVVVQEQGKTLPPPPPPLAQPPTATTTAVTSTESDANTDKPILPKQKQLDLDVEDLAAKISDDMNVHPSLAMAALGATSTSETANPTSPKYNEQLARNMIQQELDIIVSVDADSKEVQQLVAEGYDAFLARRALAFSDLNMDDARAILLADKLDEEEEMRTIAQASAAVPEKGSEQEMKTVALDANFDPASIGVESPASTPAASTQQAQMPAPAKKENVVFEATTAQIQELVIESPVPVLLDIHAEWCGPCKALSPILEDMAVKAGGIFRLVKVNSDSERPVSAALEVTALPSVFGVRDGKIQHMFQGMPKSEEMMKNFLMGLLMPGANFDPAVTLEEKAKYEELSSKLAKAAGAASFSFAAREVLQDRIAKNLDALVEAQNGDLVETEASVQILRSLLSNIISNPYDEKFRKVNLANRVISQKINKFQPCLAILKSVGFSPGDSLTLVIGKGRRVVNVAPLTVARDYLDNWIDKTRYDVAKATRKRKDEKALKELEEQGALDGDDNEEEEEEEEGGDPNKCRLKIRLAGKKKVHEVLLDADDALGEVLKKMTILADQKEEMQITCVAKRLVVKSTDKSAMGKSIRAYGLLPGAALVVKIGEEKERDASSTKRALAERAALEKKKKKGSHTMQSIGIYAKDDNAKSELIDGGGGVWYEHDVTDDEDEAAVVGDADDAKSAGEEESSAADDDGMSESPQDE